MLRRRTRPILGRDRRPLPGSVAKLEKVDVGAVEQWVLVRGVDESQPLLLIIPDGPGETLIPLAHRFQEELERAFLVANWDPRGMGLSFDPSASPSSMTLDRLAADAVELSRQLAEEFHRDRLVLAGHGFGSVVGVLAAARAPELFDAYLGVGQWVEVAESDRRGLAWAREEAERVGRSDLLEGLTRIDDPGSSPGYHRALRELGAVYQNPDGRWRSSPTLVGLREYTLLDLWVRRPRGQRRSEETVGREARSIDLLRRVSRLEVPAFFVAGRSDHVVDPSLAREYLQVLEAPRKGWAWIEDTAHLAPFEDPEAYAAALAHFAHDARGPPAPSWTVAG